MQLGPILDKYGAWGHRGISKVRGGLPLGNRVVVNGIVV